MPLSDRTKRLLDWWVLHISSTKNKSEETKENVESNNPPSTSSSSDSMGNSIDERRGVE